MNKIPETFGRERILLPVIHIKNVVTTLENIELAQENNADGVFLIDHFSDPSEATLHHHYSTARERFPDFWIGLNILGLPPNLAFQKVPQSTSAIWCDNAYITEDLADSASTAKVIWTEYRKPRTEWKGLYFGGVAFKYQTEVRNLQKVTAAAAPYMDVITTSGDKTGQPPTISKIRSMKNAAPTSAFAIASGIDASNVKHFLPYVDAYLVATGICSDFHTLDPKKVKGLAEIIHSP